MGGGAIRVKGELGVQAGQERFCAKVSVPVMQIHMNYYTDPDPGSGNFKEFFLAPKFKFPKKSNL